MPDNYRKPVAVWTDDEMARVVADDGSVWGEVFVLDQPHNMGWRELTPIPGTKRAAEREAEAKERAA